MNVRGVVITAVLAVSVAAVPACTRVQTVADQAGAAWDVASVCTEALGLADLNPLVDPARVKARAADKERRLRELAEHVGDKDVKNSLVTMADSYVQVQRERFDDLTIVAGWAKRNARNIATLRAACT
jgi:hypothetical protein